MYIHILMSTQLFALKYFYKFLLRFLAFFLVNFKENIN